MKKVRIKYNPYRVTTEISVDGKAPKSNSRLNVENFRLQEWIETLPQTLIDEYRDSNFEIEFVGTEADYNDVVAALDAFGSNISAKCIHCPTPDINAVEAAIDEIFAEIQANDKVPELKSPAIIEAFEKAKNSRFEVNVVATMSSGKSTLINALLGQQLMPAAHEATTATIVKIVDAENKDYTAVAFDKSGNKVAVLENVTLEGMKTLNSDERVSTIELRGKIPFVETSGMKLVLVDTPGPNNSRDKRHQEMTYSMIANSDKSLVLYVLNAEQSGTDDETYFLDYICHQMAKGGKQGRERFIFAVNKLDTRKPDPKNDGSGCIRRSLTAAKNALEERGILNPNLFPVASLPALQLREITNGLADEDEEYELSIFKSKIRKFEEMQFDKYYEFSNLPQSSRRLIDGLLNHFESDGEDESTSQHVTEIHTGIVSIEQAISLYVNKYARTQKVKDLVDAFNGKLEEMATIASLQDEIANDKKKAAELAQQIEQIKKNIESARNAKTLSKEIDKIDLTADVRREVSNYMESVRNQINKMESGQSRVELAVAKSQCKDLEKQCKALSAQIKVEIDKILNKAYKSTLTKIVEEYKKHLASLNLGLNAGALSFNPINLVSTSLADLNQIIEENTDTVDEGYYRTAKRRVEGGAIRQFLHGFTFGLVDDYTTETYQKWVNKYKDYVEMAEVAQDYLNPFRRSLNDIQKNTLEHVGKETIRLKEHLQNELTKIDKVLDEKLDALSQTELDSKNKTAEIAENEAKLQWLKQIQQKVKNIIEF